MTRTHLDRLIHDALQERDLKAARTLLRTASRDGRDDLALSAAQLLLSAGLPADGAAWHLDRWTPLPFLHPTERCLLFPGWDDPQMRLAVLIDGVTVPALWGDDEQLAFACDCAALILDIHPQSATEALADAIRAARHRNWLAAHEALARHQPTRHRAALDRILFDCVLGLDDTPLSAARNAATHAMQALPTNARDDATPIEARMARRMLGDTV